jgi:hypothetical protein
MASTNLEGAFFDKQALARADVERNGGVKKEVKKKRKR